MPLIKRVAGERITLLTLQEVTEILGVSERTARQYIVDGLIPACKLKRRLYVTDKNLSAFLRGAKSTRRKTAVTAPQYETIVFPSDVWEQEKQ